MQDPSAAEISRLLERLRSLGDSLPTTEQWDLFEQADWPALFKLLELGADLPRLAGNPTLEGLAPNLWPELSQVAGDLLRIQRLVDHPVVPEAARLSSHHPSHALSSAKQELAQSHCTTFEGFFDPGQKERLTRCIGELTPKRAGTWAQVESQDSVDLVKLVEEGLGGEAFRYLTGFDLSRDDYQMTLSLQDLEPSGIGWHRDLYWPKEWVGQDVFALFYALGSDSPEKGGAFLSYHPEENEIRAIYRQRHTATLLWNGRRTVDRPFHAVAGYQGEDTSRHLLILQCLRR